MLKIDSVSAIEPSKNLEYYAKMKYIAVRHHLIRENAESGEMQIE